MNNKYPLVSFVVPTHNRADLLGECIESLVSQTYNNIEIIIIDDHSVDNTSEILRNFNTKYNYIKYFINDGKGVSSARNLGIKKASGEYIAFMDDDDVCEPFRIEEQMKPLIDNNFNYDFIAHGFSTVNENNEIIKKNNYLLKTDSIGFTVRWLVRKKLLNEVGGFDVDQPNLEEVELFFRLKTKARIFFSPISVVRVRELPVSLTKDNSKMIAGIKRLLNLHEDKMGWYEKNSWLITLSRKYLEMNNSDGFKETFNKIDKGRFKLLKMFLTLSNGIGSDKPIMIYHKINRKLESIINSKNVVYPVNIK